MQAVAAVSQVVTAFLVRECHKRLSVSRIIIRSLWKWVCTKLTAVRRPTECRYLHLVRPPHIIVDGARPAM